MSSGYVILIKSTFSYKYEIKIVKDDVASRIRDWDINNNQIEG